MENTKKQLEEVIKKNLPEKDWTKNWDFHQKGCSFSKRGKWVIFPCDMNCKNVLDAKLKRMKIMEMVENLSDEYDRGYDEKTSQPALLNKLLQELSNLSYNKENE